MPLSSVGAEQALHRLGDYSDIIDARSESEYALDRLPGAINWPSLNDAERHLVGTEYKQVSPFEARKHGAALVARNVAAHIETHLMGKAREWSPLVYCWRGGQRSGALAAVLGQIGFRVQVLEGGYQSYRRAVVAALETLPLAYDFRVLCGPTGSGKSRLLGEIAAQGGQVLDLEALANHRGSVLGLVPGTAQPSQKQFDSRVWHALTRLDPSRPVFIEGESKKIGDLRVAEALVQRMRASSCCWVDLDLAQRVELLLADYGFFVADSDAFCARLDSLRAVRGNEVVDAWQALARAGRTEVVEQLLVQHYDPIYLQSMRRNYPGLGAPFQTLRWDGSAASLGAAAAAALAGIAVRADEKKETA